EDSSEPAAKQATARPNCQEFSPNLYTSSGYHGRMDASTAPFPAHQSPTPATDRRPVRRRPCSGAPAFDQGGGGRTASVQASFRTLPARRSRPAWARMSSPTSTPARLSQSPSVMKISTIEARTGASRRSDHHTYPPKLGMATFAESATDLTMKFGPLPM